MIREAKRVKVIQGEEREAWLYVGLSLVGLKMRIGEGEKKVVYVPGENDFMTGGMEPGEAAALRSATIIAPGGKINIFNEAVEHSVEWEGSLLPVGHGIHLKAKVTFEGVTDSVMHCISPRDNLKGFTDKRMARVHLKEGETVTFGDDIIGFAVLYGNTEFEGYLADPGDVYTAEEDTVIAVVTRKAPVEEDK